MRISESFLEMFSPVCYVTIYGSLWLTLDEEINYWKLMYPRRGHKLRRAILDDFMDLYAEDQWRAGEPI